MHAPSRPNGFSRGSAGAARKPKTLSDRVPSAVRPYGHGSLLRGKSVRVAAGSTHAGRGLNAGVDAVGAADAERLAVRDDDNR